MNFSNDPAVIFLLNKEGLGDIICMWNEIESLNTAHLKLVHIQYASAEGTSASSPEGTKHTDALISHMYIYYCCCDRLAHI